MPSGTTSQDPHQHQKSPLPLLHGPQTQKRSLLLSCQMQQKFGEQSQWRGVLQ